MTPKTFWLVMGGLCGFALIDSLMNPQPDCAEPSWHAQDMAKDAVRASLLAPSTANVQLADNFDKYAAGCKFTIKGTLDAQNGFGAMLRKSWRVTATRVGTDKWDITDVRVDE
jgi:hypothetical protein